MVLPHLYNGRGKTFYFGEYQGFRQVLGTTQVFPVPTAEERTGRDTTAYPGDTLVVPVDPLIAKVLAALSAAELCAGRVWYSHLSQLPRVCPRMPISFPFAWTTSRALSISSDEYRSTI